ncbi:MAG: hypothetical protein N2738_03475 [Thermodesulfovibrionales bacterium]|nr:hypothetical protein [Thermodesulfovibrionales bacterium]
MKRIKSKDLDRFKSILEGTSGGWTIDIREEPNPSIARVIIAGEWEGNLTKAKQLLKDICDRWPQGKKVKFLITCGGFIQFDWPESISLRDIGDNIKPNDKTIIKLIEEAEKYVNDVLDEDLCRKLRKVVDYITLGIDSFKEKISKIKHQPHIELVFVKDLDRGNLYWTGKSYPTSAQQYGLVRIAKLETHFLDLKVGKAMILGCHDLSIFNPRSQTAKRWRREVNKKFKELAKKESPIYVLHHPHTTVKWRTWHNAWMCLRNTLPSVMQYAGSGRYYEPDRKRSEWDDLDAVLKDTKYADTIDFIVWIR